MNIIKNKENIIILAVIIIIMLLGIICWNQSAETDFKVLKSTPGITDQECASNADCAGICNKNDKCLAASCTKSVNSLVGQCSCLGICN